MCHQCFFLSFQHLEQLGAVCELEDVGTQTLPDGKTIPLPPILYGQLGKDPKKKMICIYGHLDVQPALKVKFSRFYMENVFYFHFFFRKTVGQLNRLN